MSDRVFIVVPGAVYDAGIVGVFTDRDAAERHATVLWRNSDGHHHFRIEEWELVARDRLIQVRVSAGEREAISRLAGSAGLSVSEWVRRLASDHAGPYAAALERHDAALAESGPGDAAEMAAAARDAYYACPAARCGFVATSPSARCPQHGRSVQ